MWELRFKFRGLPSGCATCQVLFGELSYRAATAWSQRALAECQAPGSELLPYHTELHVYMDVSL